MRGWAPDGREVELSGEQERIVREILAWDNPEGEYGDKLLISYPRHSGRGIILATVARMITERMQRPRDADGDDPPLHDGDYVRQAELKDQLNVLRHEMHGIRDGFNDRFAALEARLQGAADALGE